MNKNIVFGMSAVFCALAHICEVPAGAETCSNVTGLTSGEYVSLQELHPGGTLGWAIDGSASYPQYCWNDGTVWTNYAGAQLITETPGENVPVGSWNPNVTDVCQAVVSVQQYGSNAINQLVGAQVRAENDAEESRVGRIALRAYDAAIGGRTWTGAVERAFQWTNIVGGVVDAAFPGVRTGVVDMVTQAANVVSNVGLTELSPSAADGFDWDVTQFMPPLGSAPGSGFNGVVEFVPHSAGVIADMLAVLRRLTAYLLAVGLVLFCAWCVWWELEHFQDTYRTATSVGEAGGVPLVNMAGAEVLQIAVSMAMLAIGLFGFVFVGGLIGSTAWAMGAFGQAGGTGLLASLPEAGPYVDYGVSLADKVIPVQQMFITLGIGGGFSIALKVMAWTWKLVIRHIPL